MQERANIHRTEGGSVTDALPALEQRYQLIDQEGRLVAEFDTIGGMSDFMANCALELDIQIVGSEVIRPGIQRDIQIAGAK